VRDSRGVDRIDTLSIPSHATSPIIHIHLRTSTPSLTVAAAKAPNPVTAASCDAPSFDIAGEERLLQDIVDEVLAHGVWVTGARRPCGQELVESRQSIRFAVTVALSHRECEHATGVNKAAVTKVLTKRK
jgi:serine palmitoyltransferase